jgi:hypothetical protein
MIDVAAATIKSTRVENEASAEETKVLRVASNEILALEL